MSGYKFQAGPYSITMALTMMCLEVESVNSCSRAQHCCVTFLGRPQGGVRAPNAIARLNTRSACGFIFPYQNFNYKILTRAVNNDQ